MNRSVAIALTAAVSGAAVATTLGAAPVNGARAVTGGGWYLLQNVFEVQFGFSGVLHADGSASGSFHHRTEDVNGTIDFKAKMICVVIDEETRRGWIAGEITQNDSTSPAFQGAIHQPGHDIWFRVLDGGEGGDAVDRTTFVGFESAAIPTSESYCAQRIWPADNARTWPVTSGNISVPQ